jgi:ParB-like chromosome segregation protein Spo0J
MEIRQVPIDDVHPYPGNPRTITPAAVEKVATSLREFGWQQPIVVDPQMVIVVGHTRLLAARSLGMAHVPVKVADGLSDAKIAAYRLADNRTGEEVDWDQSLLRIEIEALEAIDIDLARMTGFDTDELAAIRLFGNEGLTDPDETPPLPADPISRPGDVWLLGAKVTCPHCQATQDVKPKA